MQMNKKTIGVVIVGGLAILLGNILTEAYRKNTSSTA
jgi:hypothetical protein